MESTAILADRLVRARRGNLALPAFPGSVPATAEAAYAVQQQATRLWGAQPAGWKIGAVRPEWRADFGNSRFVGPIFPDTIRRASDGEEIEVPVVPGGFGVVEAELVVELGVDLAPRASGYSLEELDDAIGRVHVGVEIAGSAVADIVALGPCAVVADFGVNRGLIVGPQIENWRALPLAALQASARWEAKEDSEVSGSAATLEGGLAGALAVCAERLGTGISLRQGDLISTGAICGLRPLQAGRRAKVSFKGIAELTVGFRAHAS
ncbi:MAG: 2-keto-4-pentenoate hydratase [Reyranellaceae bacterium]